MAKRTRGNSLSAYWSKKERDIMLCHPSGPQTIADAHMLHGAISHDRLIGGRTLKEELEARGYDITTLRISVCKKASHPRWKDDADGRDKP